MPRCLQNKLHFKTFKYFFLLSSLLKCNLFICRICRNLPNYLFLRNLFSFIIICRFITDRKLHQLYKVRQVCSSTWHRWDGKKRKIMLQFCNFCNFPICCSKNERKQISYALISVFQFSICYLQAQVSSPWIMKFIILGRAIKSFRLYKKTNRVRNCL